MFIIIFFESLSSVFLDIYDLINVSSSPWFEHYKRRSLLLYIYSAKLYAMVFMNYAVYMN